MFQSKKKNINIKFILCVRLFSSYYYNFFSVNFLNYITKGFCISMALIVFQSVLFFYYKRNVLLTMAALFMTSCYLINILTSFTKPDELMSFFEQLKSLGTHCFECSPNITLSIINSLALAFWQCCNIIMDLHYLKYLHFNEDFFYVISVNILLLSLNVSYLTGIIQFETMWRQLRHLKKNLEKKIKLHLHYNTLLINDGVRDNILNDLNKFTKYYSGLRKCLLSNFSHSKILVSSNFTLRLFLVDEYKPILP